MDTQVVDVDNRRTLMGARVFELTKPWQPDAERAKFITNKCLTPGTAKMSSGTRPQKR